VSPLAQELRDIRGLDPAPWWPIAPGWWLVALAVLVLAVAAVLVALWWRNRVPGSWQADARRQFRLLEDRLRWADARSAAVDLSVLLRRVAMARHGRRACAGLEGERWLEWLERHDPTGFRWREEGRPLIDLPYAPPRERDAGERLSLLVRAAGAWATAEGPPEEPALGAEALPAGAAARGGRGV
jgi:hypothetical protein